MFYFITCFIVSQIIFSLFYEKFINFIFFLKLSIDLSFLFIISKLKLNIPNFLIKQLYFDINRNGYFTIKFVQWVLTRCKLLYEEESMPEWVHLFNNFYENCDIHSFHYTQKVLETEFNSNINNIFNNIQTKPIASGSIAQIYKCNFKLNNKDCVLKIVHPKLKEKSYFSLKFLKFFELLLKSKYSYLLKNFFPTSRSRKIL